MKPTTLTMPCPYCQRELETLATDGEVVYCRYCTGTSEVHDASAVDLSTNQELPVYFLEPISR